MKRRQSSIIVEDAWNTMNDVNNTTLRYLQAMQNRMDTYETLSTSIERNVDGRYDELVEYYTIEVQKAEKHWEEMSERYKEAMDAHAENVRVAQGRMFEYMTSLSM